MQSVNWIKNTGAIASTERRKQALRIIESGYNAIDTEQVIASSVSLVGNSLLVKDKSFDLSKFDNVKVIGFGKAAGRAAFALEKIIGHLIGDSAVVSTIDGRCERIKMYMGSHPYPTRENVKASREILNIAEKANKKDLVIVIISGGGSALLCWPEEECDQGQRLYKEFLKSGGHIGELNMVREHISLLKGGGLAKSLYPATVVSLIFSDVPGSDYHKIASGPTFKSQSTIHDAETIINKYKLGDFHLVETPKDDKYFEKVHNILLVSNEQALQAMQWSAGELGYHARILSSEIYDSAEDVPVRFVKSVKPGEVILGGGEPRLVVDDEGSGGRNLYVSLIALKHIKSDQLFCSFASDGEDNCEVAGAFADQETIKKAREKGLDTDEFIKRYDPLVFFKETNDTIMTGPTGANVSDLMFLIS
jgi:glycerate 2-kinase